MTDRQELRELLLGGLAPKDADDLEERIFADDALYEEIAAEHEILVEEYVAESLTDEDAARFERQRSLSPELAAKVAELRDLKTLLKRRNDGGPGGAVKTLAFGSPLLTAIAACLIGLVFLLCVQWRQNSHLHTELAQRIAGPQTTLKTIPAKDDQNEGFVFLAARVVRGSQNVTHVEIAPGTSLMQLQIEIPESEASAKSWFVEVNHNGQEIFRSDAVFARRVGSISYLPIYISGESLPPGTYSVRIRSNLGQSDESRSFTIEHAPSPTFGSMNNTH